jgi:zinc transport system substrate-binding protein
MDQRPSLSVGRVTWIGAALGVLLAGCSGATNTGTTTTRPAASEVVGSGAAKGNAEAVRVVAAFAPLAELANRIGGDRVMVTNLTPAGSKAHDTELTPKDTDALSNAELVLLLGRNFQPAVQDGVGQLPDNVARLDLLASMELLAFDEAADEDELDGGFDPHVWVDPVNMAIMAESVATSLSALRPELASVFAENAKEYVGELDALTREMTAGLANCQSRIMVTGHRAFAYLAKRLDLTQIAIAGINPGIEPSPKDLEAIAEEAKQAGVTTVFFEEALPKDLAETVANEIGADTGSLNPVETISQAQLDAGEGYIDIQRANLVALQRGLVCS